MSSTVLTLVQDFTEKFGLPTPSALVGSTEKSVRQLRSLMRENVADLSEFKWQQQTVRGTWTTVAGNDQGVLETLFPGYRRLIPGSLWNETRRMRIYGPLSDQIWAALKILPNAGPEFQCYVADNHLLVSPPFVNGETAVGTYQTKYGVLSNASVPKERITADDDTLVFPDNVVIRGLEWRWKKVKGEAGWEDDFNTYQSLIAGNIVKDSATTLGLATNNRGPRPGIVVPAGSWNV